MQALVKSMIMNPSTLSSNLFLMFLTKVSYWYIRSNPRRSKLARQDWRVDSISRVSHLSYIALDRISSVLCCLNTAIGKGDHILTKNCSLGILMSYNQILQKFYNKNYLRFTLLKTGLGFCILNSILIAIWLRGKFFHWIGLALGGSCTSRYEGDEQDQLKILLTIFLFLTITFHLVHVVVGWQFVVN